MSSKRLYIRGLHKDITEEELYKYLSCYGKITEVKLLTNYAFVQFDSKTDASFVLETYREQSLLGRNVVIEFAHPLRKDLRSFTSNYSSDKTPSPPYMKPCRHPVIVMGIPPSVQWQELKDFGRLSGGLVAFCDLDRIKKGRGFIEYFTREDANKAVRILDGQRLGGRSVVVVDHESLKASPESPRRLWRKSRSMSPKRHRPGVCINDATQSYDKKIERPDVRTRPSIDQGYDPLCPHPSNPYLRRGYEHFSSIKRDRSHRADLSAFDRVSSWALASMHHHHVYDDYQSYGYGLHQASNGEYYDEKSISGYGWSSHIDRDSQPQRPEDPYL